MPTADDEFSDLFNLVTPGGAQRLLLQGEPPAAANPLPLRKALEDSVFGRCSRRGEYQVRVARDGTAIGIEHDVRGVKVELHDHYGQYEHHTTTANWVTDVFSAKKEGVYPFSVSGFGEITKNGELTFITGPTPTDMWAPNAPDVHPPRWASDLLLRLEGEGELAEFALPARTRFGDLYDKAGGPYDWAIVVAQLIRGAFAGYTPRSLSYADRAADEDDEGDGDPAEGSLASLFHGESQRVVPLLSAFEAWFATTLSADQRRNIIARGAMEAYIAAGKLRIAADAPDLVDQEWGAWLKAACERREAAEALAFVLERCRSHATTARILRRQLERADQLAFGGHHDRLMNSIHKVFDGRMLLKISMATDSTCRWAEALDRHGDTHWTTA